MTAAADRSCEEVTCLGSAAVLCKAAVTAASRREDKQLGIVRIWR